MNCTFLYLPVGEKDMNHKKVNLWWLLTARNHADMTMRAAEDRAKRDKGKRAHAYMYGAYTIYVWNIHLGVFHK